MNCPHCSTQRKGHLIHNIDYYIDKFVWNHCIWLGSLVLKKIKNSESRFMALFFQPLAKIKIVKLIDKPNETKFCNRSLIFFKEAKRRGLDVKAIKFLGKHTLVFKLIYKNKTYYYSGTPLHLKPTNPIIDNKIKVKTLLEKNNLPTAQGKIFTSSQKAFNYGKRLGYPLVAKPNSGSLSHHVTCDINSEEELLKAIKIAKIYKPDFIVEKYIIGNLYRATVVGKKYVFVCQKELANVVGNEHSTIAELINIKNKNKKRGEAHQINKTLHKIAIDDMLRRNLKNCGLNLKSILPKNKKVFLQDKYILSLGCDIINCTQEMHIDNKEVFIKISHLLQTDIIGIDFICPDISKSYQEQKTAILETNSLPYIDMHQYPSHGQPEPVAKIAWDVVLDDLK